VAAEAGITRVLLYRHFDSKADLYRAVLERACSRLAGSDSAAADPDAFRLLFRYAAREPEFRDLTDSLTAASTDIARRNLATLIPDGPWLGWASRLIPALTIEP
jgi:AcrR family transcriptional regulator